MIEPALPGQRSLQRVLARMAERRMADVVRQTDRLGQVLVQPQRARDGAADLRHLQTVRQADAEMVAVGRHEHLRLVAQAAKADRVDHAVAVALERVARTAKRVGRFGVPPAPTVRRMRRIGRAARSRACHSVSSLEIFWPASLVKVKAFTPALDS